VFIQVASVIKKCFSGCIVELYGSSATGLALPNSDLDLFVSGSVGDTPWHDLAPFLREFGAVNLQVIASSRIPLIKLRDPLYGLNVDISFGSNLVAPSVELVKSWVSELDRFKVIII
jgi:DNA polymerase sigma